MRINSMIRISTVRYYGIENWKKNYAAIRYMSTRLPSPFKMERYLGIQEFRSKYLLSCSDVEALTIPELLSYADFHTKKNWENLKLSYTEMTGDPRLRKEIANIHNVDRDDVMVVAPQEGIFIAMTSLMEYLKRNNNDEPVHAISLFPAYKGLYEILNTHSCDMSYWRPTFTRDGWVFDIKEMQRLVKANTKLLVVNFPHNPTGFLPESADWQELIEFCRDENIFIFSDEIYGFTNNDGTNANSSVCALYENSISVSGLSKAYGLPGLRIGWTCTRNTEIYNMMWNLKDYITICPAAPSEVLASIALQNREIILRRTLGIIERNLVILNEFFAHNSDIFEWHVPRAGTTTFVMLKGWILEIGCGGATGFAEKLLKDKGILILPASMYDFEDRHVRIGFGRHGLKESVIQLQYFLDENRPY